MAFPRKWSPKTLTEWLCSQQTYAPDRFTRYEIQRLVDVLALHRPTGTNGKHGSLHTPTCGCEDVASDSRPAESAIGASASAFGSVEGGVSEPVGEGSTGLLGCGDESGVLGVAGSESLDVAAGVINGRTAGSGAHSSSLAATESIDNRDFSGHNKDMTTKRIPADNIITGLTVIPPGKSAPVEVIGAFDRGGQREVYCIGHRGRSVFIISRYDDIEMVIQ